MSLCPFTLSIKIPTSVAVSKPLREIWSSVNNLKLSTPLKVVPLTVIPSNLSMLLTGVVPIIVPKLSVKLLLTAVVLLARYAAKPL